MAATNAMYGPDLGHVVIDDSGAKPMDVCLAQAALALNITVQLTGGSGFGWSRQSTLQACAYRYFLKYKKEMPIERKSTALDLGSVVHAFLAVYYQRLIDAEADAPLTAEPGVLCDKLLDLGASAIIVNEGWRLFEAYANFWEHNGDYLIPRAVEFRVSDPHEPRTARYDLVAEVLPGGHLMPGIYCINHKTTSRLTRDLTEGYHLDGQILDEIALYTRAGLHRRFGPLQGVIINILVKTAVPNFHREIVSPPTFQLRRQAKDLRVHRAMLGIYEATNTWPRSLGSCVGRYGFCDFWEHCREGGK
jgi:hypothetical protein